MMESERLQTTNNRFVALSNVQKGSTGISVFGVVRESKYRGQSRKGDFMLTFALVDQTNASLSVSMFSKDMNSLPESVSAGHLVRLANIKIQEFNGKPQALSSYATKFSAFSSPAEMPATDPDLPIAKSLHTWYLEKNILSVKSGIADQGGGGAIFPGGRKVKTLDALKEPSEYFDLYCQVVHVLQEANTVDDKVVLVTDYTQPQFNNGHYDDSILLYPVSTRVFKITLWDTSTNPASPPSNQSLQTTGFNRKEMAMHVSRGAYVYFRNIVTKLGRSGVLEGGVHGEREGGKSVDGRWGVLGRECMEVGKLRRRLTELGVTLNTSVYSLTTTPAYISKTTIKEMLKHAATFNSDKPEPTRYRFEARVIDHLPTRFDFFARTVCDYDETRYGDDGICAKCGHSDTGRVQWMFSLLLGDGEAFVPVVVSGDEAAQFLRMQPLTCPLSKTSIELLKDACSALWEVGGEGQPRVSEARNTLFCVQSYWPSEEYGVRFKLIKTELNW